MDNLQEKVQAALQEDARTREAPIEVLNENGIITLTGFVTHLETREIAEEITKDVDGVVSVVNDIKSREGDSDSTPVVGTFHHPR
jgi:osmotically-inducible protein OsmY